MVSVTESIIPLDTETLIKRAVVNVIWGIFFRAIADIKSLTVASIEL